MKPKKVSKQVKIKLLFTALFAGISFATFNYQMENKSIVETYESDRQQESSLRSQVESLTSETQSLQDTVDNSSELVSFSDDKIRYITLASDLSKSYNVKMNKFTVSDIWKDAEMSVMTTKIELVGALSDIRKFVDAYASTNYVNRVNIVSLRQDEDFVWVSRDIDGKPILSWFNLDSETAYWQSYYREKELEKKALAAAAGEVYNSPLDAEKEPISMQALWEETPMKIYLEIDFLGRE